MSLDPDQNFTLILLVNFEVKISENYIFMKFKVEQLLPHGVSFCVTVRESILKKE